MNTDAEKKPKRARCWVVAALLLAVGVCVFSDSDFTPVQVKLANWMPQSRAPLTEREISVIRNIADAHTSKPIKHVDRDEDGTVVVWAGGDSIGVYLHFRRVLFRWVLVQEGSWIT